MLSSTVRKLLLVGLLTLLGALMVGAQTGLSQHIFYGAYAAFYYPSGWELTETEDGFTSFQTEQTSLFMAFYYLPNFEDLGIDDDPASVVRHRLTEITLYEGQEFDESLESLETVNDQELYVYSTTAVQNGESYEAYEIVRRVSAYTYTVGVVFPFEGETVDADDLEIAKEIIASGEGWFLNEDGVTADLVGTFRFDVPEGWLVKLTDEDRMYVEKETQRGLFLFSYPEDLEEAELVDADFSELLPYALSLGYPDSEIEPSITDFETVTENERDVIVYPYTLTKGDETYAGVYVMTFLEDGTLMAIDFFDVKTGNSEPNQEDIDALISVLSTMRVPVGEE